MRKDPASYVCEEREATTSTASEVGISRRVNCAYGGTRGEASLLTREGEEETPGDAEKVEKSGGEEGERRKIREEGDTVRGQG